jgi:MscS family membrane protein
VNAPLTHAPFASWLLAGLLFALAAPQGRGGEPPQRYRSPRATVRTLLTAITLARGGEPRRLEEAGACLDLTGLPARQRNTGGVLATQLEAILRARDVDTEALPDNLEEAAYVLPGKEAQRIALRRTPDGRWLFDRETVAQIPALFLETRKQRLESNREAAALNVSHDHASPRAAFRSLVEGYRRQDHDRILHCFDLGDIPNVARQEVGTQLANKLKQIVLRCRLPILQEIPDSNYSDPYVWLSRPEGVIEVVRLPSGARKGEWVFSRDTVRSIDKLYAAFEDQPYLEEILATGATRHLPGLWGEPELWLRSHLPGWLRVSVLTTRRIRLELYELLGYLLVPALAYGLYRLTVWLLWVCLHQLLVRRGWALPRETLVRRLRPAGWFVGVLFLRGGLLVLEPDTALLVVLLGVLTPLVWLLGMWAVFRVLDLVADVMEAHLAAEKGRPEITQMFWPVGSLVLKIGLLVATTFHLMALFNWEVATVLTGLGIGGLAFALGAQDSLKNLFGSFTLIADRPFVVGESVKIGSHEVGVVEVVGLRSTRIRTPDDTLLIVPNSNLTTMEITNYGRRRYRRYHTRIGVAYGTPLARLTAYRDALQEAVQANELTHKKEAEIAIHDLAASAVEILVHVYFEVANRREELAARDALIQEFLRLAEQMQVELAFPTQTIHLAPAPAAPAGGGPA